MLFFQRAIIGCSCVVLASLLAACNLNGKTEPGKPVYMGTDLTNFENNPTVATFEAVHNDILVGSLDASAEERLVNRLMAGGVSDRIVNAVVADLVASDFLGALRWVRELNVTARIGNSSQGSAITRNSARLGWLMLAMRPYDDTGGVDLSHMDLRGNAPFIGQNMNLQGANFSGSYLSGGVWRDSDLSNAVFPRSIAAGPLTCADCTWGSARATLQLHDGRWVTP
ncbi:MAG: pentapeptide repeat-containing protein [Candidatus Eremiobacteraeota bacterium]|nr:pentapeptide repeat-containing protein [Candidatus Eremiobacteraeota bacterium]